MRRGARHAATRGAQAGRAVPARADIAPLRGRAGVVASGRDVGQRGGVGVGVVVADAGGVAGQCIDGRDDRGGDTGAAEHQPAAQSLGAGRVVDRDAGIRVGHRRARRQPADHRQHRVHPVGDIAVDPHGPILIDHRDLRAPSVHVDPDVIYGHPGLPSRAQITHPERTTPREPERGGPAPIRSGHSTARSLCKPAALARCRR